MQIVDLNVLLKFYHFFVTMTLADIFNLQRPGYSSVESLEKWLVVENILKAMRTLIKDN